MLVEKFITYDGKYYDVGTRFKFRAMSWGYYQGIKEGTLEEIINTTAFIRSDDGEIYECSTITNDWTKNIIEVIQPIYYVANQTPGTSRQCPPDWQIEMGITWYIIIMVVGAIFQARLLIWVFATAYFILWKNGFLNGGNK